MAEINPVGGIVRVGGWRNEGQCPVCGANDPEQCVSLLTGLVYRKYRHHGRPKPGENTEGPKNEPSSDEMGRDEGEPLIDPLDGL